MVKSANLGFPRLGINREWKKASEKYWKNEISSAELDDTYRVLIRKHWKLQIDEGIDIIPVNDFAYYDHVLDTIALLGAVPPRFAPEPVENVDIDTYFAMARGRQDNRSDVTAMEMTKWFDTNYHYIVPEFYRNTSFRLSTTQPFQAVELARDAGVKNPRPVLLGPVSFLFLGKPVEADVSIDRLLESALNVYKEILRRFQEQKVEWVQIDEPILVRDLDEQAQDFFRIAYSELVNLAERPKIMLTTYFGSLGDNAELTLSLKTEGLHLDLVSAPDQLDSALTRIKPGQVISLGVVDGRNVWRADLDRILYRVKRAIDVIGPSRIQIAPSCSLLHIPIDLDPETDLDSEIRQWLSFGKQKLEEVNLLVRSINEGIDPVAEEFENMRKHISERKSSAYISNPTVKARMDRIDTEMKSRKEAFTERMQIQQERFNLPLLPTTTVGSFPQTREIRRYRSDFYKGSITDKTYKQKLRAEIKETLAFQEDVGLDVLVHGEYERPDMVEYFGKQLNGFAFTRNGWVQSYGSRAVKPPIIYGDISRDKPMSVAWSKYADKNTDKPVKAILTGPVTMLQWSFARDDQTRRRTAEQLALVIRDEVKDLEKAGIGIIQIDEPALREGLPLRKSEWSEYLRWAVDCFRLASSGVKAETQIHTHMCYSEFNDIIDSIADMDADVISIEASRSRMELLDCFDGFEYPNQIGPGVYDIHSPRVPSAEEIAELIRRALKFIPKERLWINPDCGLKTRGWKEVKPALENMVEAVKVVRGEIG